MQLTSDQKAIHLSQNYLRLEWQIIQVLQQIEASKFFLKLEVTSLFKYAVQFLKLSEPTAYAFITVARKAQIFPVLGEAIQAQKISVYKASRIVSTLDKTNVLELIDFAERNSTRAIDVEVARRNPKARSQERAKPISENLVELKFCVLKETNQKLRRAQSILAQKQGKHLDMAQTLDTVLNDYLQKNDPVEKGNRAVKKVKLCSTEFKASAKKTGENAMIPEGRLKMKKILTRSPLSALEKHQVFARDGGRCTYKDQKGQRCDNDRWLHIHHIHPVSQDGTNALENLTTLCSVHHDLVHQLSLPIEGQVTWLKASSQRYGSFL